MVIEGDARSLTRLGGFRVQRLGLCHPIEAGGSLLGTLGSRV